MRKYRSGFKVYIILTMMIGAAVIAMVRFYSRERQSGKSTVEAEDEVNIKKVEIHKKYALTNPAEKLEIQGSEISYTPESIRSNQLEDMISFIAENLEKADK